MDVSTLRNLIGYYQNINLSRAFRNTSRNWLWWNHFLTKTQGYCQQPRFLLNSITDDRCFMRLFRSSCTKSLGNYPEKTCVGEFPLNKFTRLQYTAYLTRNSTANTFLEVLRKEIVFKNLENFQKISVQNCTFFFDFTSLQSRIFDFNKIRFQGKCFFMTVLWNN